MRERTRLRPTAFGIAVTGLVVGVALLRPSVADPSVAGLVLAGLGGALVFGVVWPVLTVRMLGVRIVDAPSDLVVGQLVTVTVELSGRASGLSVGAAGSATAVVDVVAPGRLRLPVTIARRGAYGRLGIEIGSDAPFGIAYASRVRYLELPRQMLVGPEPAEQSVEPGDLAGRLQDPMPHGFGVSGETVRSVRPYVTGDPAHLVHWPSTARTGTLVVRELEPPAARGLAIMVDLRDERLADTASSAGADPVDAEPDVAPRVDLAELAAGIAAGAARDARRRGARVMLCTAELDGPVVAESPDELSVQRRLALAVAEAPAPPPEGWPVLVITPASAAARMLGGQRR